MIHPSHMTKDAFEASARGDLEALIDAYFDQEKVWRAAASAKFVPYEKSQNFRSVGAHEFFERNRLDAIFYGIAGLLGWDEDRARLEIATREASKGDAA